MNLDWVRRNYGVPAKLRGRIEYTGGSKPRLGTITGADGGHIRILLDGDKHDMPYHPTWKLRYLDAETAQGEQK